MLELAHSIAVADTIAAVMGPAAAYVGVVLVACLQETRPEELSGRVMNPAAFSAVALVPLSYALAGALLPPGGPRTAKSFRTRAGTQQAVANCSLRVGRAGALALVGESGCAKTTALRIAVV